MRSQQTVSQLQPLQQQPQQQQQQQHQQYNQQQQQQQHPIVLQHQLQSMQFTQEVTINDNNLNLTTASDANGQIVGILNPIGSTSQLLCRPVIDNGDAQQLTGETWGVAQLLAASADQNTIGAQMTDEDRNLAASIVQFVQRHPLIGDLNNITKVINDRPDTNNSNTLLDHPIRLYHSPADGVEIIDSNLMNDNSLQTLPSITPLKRVHDTLWYPKYIKGLDVEPLVNDYVELNNGPVVINKQSIKKSLPHKKRISKKLKKNTSQTINDHGVPDVQEAIEIIEENVNQVHRVASHLIHNTANEENPSFICQICGDFYGDDQLQFYHHLKEHYEPNNTPILLEHNDNAISVDKISESLVANTPLPDSLVELSLDDTNKTLYQSQAKIPEFSNAEKSLYNMSISKNSLYSDDKIALLQKLNYANNINQDKLSYSCTQCPKTFKRHKLYDAHIKEAHSKVEEMSEFSEPEDLMEGIVVVEPENEEFLQEDLSSQHSNGIILQNNMDNQDQYILPHLTIDQGSISQSNLNSKDWFKDNSILQGNVKENSANSGLRITSVESSNQENTNILLNSNVDNDEEVVCPMCGGVLPNQEDYQIHAEKCHMHLQEEDLQRMIEIEIDVSDTEPGEIGSLDEMNAEVESEEEGDKEGAGDEDEQPKKRPKTLLTCMDCGKQFRYRNSIIYHMMSHEGNKPFKCEICQKCFFTACALKVHNRLHTGVKPYKCIDCGKRFRQWGDLKYHFISIHSNLKQHQCEYCGKNFARKYSLIIHRRIHTGEKNYRCEFCDKTFRASSYLQNHRKIHTGEKPYPCELCGKKFRMKGDMRRHFKIHSKKKPPPKAVEEEENVSSSTKQLKTKPTSTLMQDSKVMKIEKEEAQPETENDDNSGDTKRTILKEEIALSSSSETGTREDVKMCTNFPIDNNGAMYAWPLFIS